MFFLCVFALGVDMVYFAGVLLVALGFGRRKHTEGHTGPFRMPRLFLSNPFVRVPWVFRQTEAYSLSCTRVLFELPYWEMNVSVVRCAKLVPRRVLKNCTPHIQMESGEQGGPPSNSPAGILCLESIGSRPCCNQRKDRADSLLHVTCQGSGRRFYVLLPAATLGRI